MYSPKHFNNPNLNEMHQLIVETGLGTLIAEADGKPEASHVPCLLTRSEGGNGSLRFHLAGANPMVALLEQTRSHLLIFLGADCYISPDWYTSHDQVPTWNYASVHCYGTARRLEDHALLRLLADLSAVHEKSLPKPEWTPDKLAPDDYARLRRAIVGYEMAIDEIQGKWKMSQNRQVADRKKAVSALRELGGDRNLAVADKMAAIDA